MNLRREIATDARPSRSPRCGVRAGWCPGRASMPCWHPLFVLGPGSARVRRWSASPGMGPRAAARSVATRFVFLPAAAGPDGDHATWSTRPRDDGRPLESCCSSTPDQAGPAGSSAASHQCARWRSCLRAAAGDGGDGLVSLGTCGLRQEVVPRGPSWLCAIGRPSTALLCGPATALGLLVPHHGPQTRPKALVAAFAAVVRRRWPLIDFALIGRAAAVGSCRPGGRVRAGGVETRSKCARPGPPVGGRNRELSTFGPGRLSSWPNGSRSTGSLLLGVLWPLLHGVTAWAWEPAAGSSARDLQ
jgi:hypothetical protein